MIERLSQLLLPTLKSCNLPALRPGERSASSTRMLMRAGFISQSSSGMYSLLPLGLNVLERIQAIIDEEMKGIGAAKCAIPCLQPASLWARTGRLQAMQDSMYVLNEEEQLVLAPTHEEEVTRLVAQHVSSAARLPLRLYQIGPKFRREHRPRAGLLRLREFIMKDMYSFDMSLESARDTYSATQEAYERIFKRIGVKVLAAEASCGDMGGSQSHEYHLLADAGEDNLLLCQHCSWMANEEVASTTPSCKHCGGELKKVRGLELGHTFLLGTRYTHALGANLRDENGTRVPMQMGCYGIGVSRLLAAVAEVCSTENGLSWPASIAPYHVIITAGQSPSSEAVEAVNGYALQLQKQQPALRIAIDDRLDLSLGWRLKDAELIGVPSTLVFGRDWNADGKLELHQRGQKDHQWIHSDEVVIDRLLAV